MRLPTPCLMLVTDRHRCTHASMLEAIEAAVLGGVDAVQLREKDLSSGELYSLALQVRRLTAGRCLFSVNERLDVALAVGADGVHLPENALSIEAARRLSPSGFLIGRSVHGVEGARQAEADGASYVQLGTIFETESKPGLEPAGLDLVRRTTASIKVPCIAVGGIGAENAAAVMAAGAGGVAVVSAVLQARDAAAAVGAIKHALAMAASAPPLGGRPWSA